MATHVVRSQLFRLFIAMFAVLFLTVTKTNAQSNQLVFTTLPSSTALDQPFTVVVTAETSLGATVTSFNSAVTITIGTNSSGNNWGVLGNGSLPAPGSTNTSATVTASSGVATFSDIYLTAAGSYTFVASASGYSNVTSSSFSVVSSTLVLAHEPPTYSAGACSMPYSDWCNFKTYVVPHIDGVVLSVNWNTIDTVASTSTTGCLESTTCSWSTVDTVIADYASLKNSANKNLKVAMLVYPVSDTTTNTATPAYVFTTATATAVGAGNAQDVSACGFYPGDTATTSNPINTGAGNYGVWNQSSQCWSSQAGHACAASPNYSDITGQPVVYELPFETMYAHFIAQVLTHYSSAGSGNGSTVYKDLAYIRFGMVSGAEAFPTCETAWPPPGGLSAGNPPGATYGNFVYTSYTSTPPSGYYTYIDSEIYGDSPQVPIAENTSDGAGATNQTHTLSDGEASVAAHYGIGIGMESLSNNDPDAYALSVECQSDWCNNFQTASSPRYLQDINVSASPLFSLNDIGNSTACTSSLCTATCTTGTAYCNFGLGASAIGYVSITGTTGNGFTGNYFNNSWFYNSGVGSVSTQTAFTFNTSGTSGSYGATGGSVWAPGFIDLNYPFAAEQNATALEVNKCNYSYAYGYTATGCSFTGPGSGLGSATDYATVISSISGK